MGPAHHDQLCGIDLWPALQEGDSAVDIGSAGNRAQDIGADFVNLAGREAVDAQAGISPISPLQPCIMITAGKGPSPSSGRVRKAVTSPGDLAAAPG